MVASSTPLDQFMVHNPEYFFGKVSEAGIVDPENLVILVSHLKCALFELPINEREHFGVVPTEQVLDFLAQERLVKKSGDKYHYTSDVYPASEVSLRSASPENFVIMDESNNGRAIGEIDYFSAPELIHPEAIYLHQSAQFQVRSLDWDGHRAYVLPVSVEYYTDAESKVTVKVLHTDQEEQLEHRIVKGIGDISLTRVVVRYKKVRFHTHENLGWGRVDLPEQEMHTSSFWISFPEDIANAIGISVDRLAGAMYGASHLLREVVPVWVLSDPADIRAYSMVKSPFNDLPTIYIYETVPGGVGFSRRIFDMFGEIVDGALSLVRKCGCKDGCPSCVGPILEIGEEGKSGAEAILRLLKINR